MCDAGFIGRIITASQPQPPRARNSRVEEYSFARFSHGFFSRSTRADQVRLMSVAYLHPTPQPSATSATASPLGSVQHTEPIVLIMPSNSCTLTTLRFPQLLAPNRQAH